MRRSFLRTALGATVAAGAAASFQASAEAPARSTRVVVQVSDGEPARWTLVLNNVRNLQDDMGAGNVQIEIVAYGPGIGMLKFDSPANSGIAEVLKRGVAVQACENSMRNQKLARTDMHPAVTYVPAGVVQIVRRQQDGWIYLRP